MKKPRLLLLVVVLLASFLPMGSLSAATSSSYDLIEAVNQLRDDNGLDEIATDSALMSAAQTQADYLAATCGDNYESCDGHTGLGGTRAYDRALAAGYNLTSGMNVVENWAGRNSSITLSEVIYETWADADHMGNMLNVDAVAIGAGVSESNGELNMVYYVINIGVLYGSGGSSSANTGVSSTVPTTAVTSAIALVQVATPQADGLIVHIVDTGQSLWNIAAAYDVTVDELKEMNNLSSDIITSGQEVVVQISYTATPTIPSTATPRQPTRTPVPAQTAQAIGAQEESSEDESGDLFGMDRQTMGLALILICGAGLALVVIGTIGKDKDKTKDKDKEKEKEKEKKPPDPTESGPL